MWLLWNEKRTILTREKKNITNGFVFYTLKPEIEMWSKQQQKTHSDDNIMQEKNVKNICIHI